MTCFILKIGDFHFFSLHLLFEHLVCILQAHYPQSHLVFANSPWVSGFFRCKVIFPPPFPIFPVFLHVLVPALFRVVGHVIERRVKRTRVWRWQTRWTEIVCPQKEQILTNVLFFEFSFIPKHVLRLGGCAIVFIVSFAQGSCPK